MKTPFHLLSLYCKAIIHYRLKILTNFENWRGEKSLVEGCHCPTAGYGPDIDPTTNAFYNSTTCEVYVLAYSYSD